MAVARSRQQLSLRCRPSLPTTLCLQYFYGFLGEGAEQPSRFFSSFLGNHLPFANKLPVSPPREGGEVLAHQGQPFLLFLFPALTASCLSNRIQLALVTGQELPEAATSLLQRGHLSARVSFRCSVASSRENRTAGFKALTGVTQWDLMTC